MKVRPTRRQREVMEMLAAEPMRLVDLAQATGRGPQRMSVFLGEMLRKELIARVSYGRYWLKDPLADALRLPEAEVYEGLPPAEVARLKRVAALKYG